MRPKKKLLFCPEIKRRLRVNLDFYFNRPVSAESDVIYIGIVFEKGRLNPAEVSLVFLFNLNISAYDSELIDNRLKIFSNIAVR